MLCAVCSKLGFLYKENKCKSCKVNTNISIYSLCDTCSEKEQKCSSCLKKVYKKNNHPIYKVQMSGCSSCKKS